MITLIFAVCPIISSQLMASEDNDSHIVCKQDNMSKFSFKEIKKNSNKTDAMVCAELGFTWSLADENETANYRAVNRYDPNMFSKPFTQNNPIDNWLKGVRSSFNFENCTPSLTNKQEKMLSDLHNISNKMICSSMGLDESVSSKNKNKHRPQKTKIKIPIEEILTSDTRDKVNACFCLSKIGAPLKADAELTEFYKTTVSEFFRKQYLDSLITVRLNEYTLGKNILGIDGQKACESFENDKEIESAKLSLNLPPEINTIFSTVKNQNEANTLFNLDSATKNNPPIVSEKVFKSFAEKWSCILKNGKPPYDLMKLAQDDARKMKLMLTSSNAKFEKGEVDDFEKREASCKGDAPADKDEGVEEITYLQSILSNPIGDSQITFYEELTKMLIKDGITSDNFEKSFKKIITTHMKKQCNESHEKIAQLGKHNIVSLLSENDLMKFLIGKNAKKALDIQKLHCMALQKELSKAPEDFLKNFCDYNDNGKLPPPKCQSIGNFMNASFTGSSNNPDSSIDIQDDITKIISASKPKATSLHYKNKGSFSRFMKSISKDMKNSGGSSINVDMANYSPEKLSPSNVPAQTLPSNSGVTNTKEASTQGTIQSQTTNIMAAQGSSLPGSSPSVNNSLGQTPLPPSISYENKTKPTQEIVSAQPKAAIAPALPAPSTSISEKSSIKENNPASNLAKNNPPEQITEVKQSTVAVATSNSPIIAPVINKPITNNSSSASFAPKMPSYQEAARNPTLIPEESIQKYINARRFEQGLVVKKDGFDSKEDGLSDLLPPETGLMLNAFKTGKIEGKDITKILLGEEIKDLKSFEQTNTYQGAIVIVEDKVKKLRYLCRAFITDSKDGFDKLLPIGSGAPSKDELGGYKCTTEKKAEQAIIPLTIVEKKEAQKAISSSERLYKAFVLDKIVKGAKKK